MESIDNIPCKVVLIGETGVGKTSIIDRYIKNTFDYKVSTTVASTFVSKIFQYKNLKKTLSFDIWDTAGHEKFRSITTKFYKNASIGILVYDITDKHSFDLIKNYWYKQLIESCDENVVIGIAGNKCDLYEKEEVSENEVEEFASSIDAIFEPTSCKKNEGIDKLFYNCGKKFLENYNPKNFTNKKPDKKFHLDKMKNNSYEEIETKEKKKKKFC